MILSALAVMVAAKKPPFERTGTIVTLLGEIMRLVGRYEGLMLPSPQPKLRRQNRIKTIAATTAIEGNTLSLDQVTAVFDGKRVVGPEKDILEVQNTIEAYSSALKFKQDNVSSFLKAHKILLQKLLPDAGKFRKGSVGILKGKKVVHTAPPADRVRFLVENLFRWSKAEKAEHPLLVASVVHYELAFIHPFMDGNGRTARLWQHIMNTSYAPVFEFAKMESMIRENQKDYYKSLSASDQLGASTPFIEFSLQVLHDSTKQLLADLHAPRATGAERLAHAQSVMGKKYFSRKEYMSIHKQLSSAQASRDLRDGANEKILTKKGAASQTQYAFKS